MITALLSLLLITTPPPVPPDSAPPTPEAQPESPPETPQEATPPKGPRVIVHAARHHDTAGYLIDASDTELVLVTRTGQTVRMDPKTIQYVELLLDPPAPIDVAIAMRNRKVLRGELIRDGFDSVDVRISGINLTLDRTELLSMTPLESTADRYQRLRDRYPVDHQSAHLKLCRWLVSEGAWEEAISELDRHLLQHRSSEASQLRRVAKARSNFKSVDDDAITPTAQAQSHLPPPVNDETVNLVRLYEIHLKDAPKIAISTEARQALIDAYATSSLIPSDPQQRNTLLNGPAIDVLELMFQLRAREHYAHVQVLSEPPSLRRFRQHVHDAWLVPRCGMTDCHGGPDAGRFKLYRSPRLTDGMRTSNLLILDELTVDDGPMINWKTPSESILLQYALPRSEATHPHPPVEGWKAVFPRVRSGAMSASVRWIESMMRSPRPEYPVTSPISTQPSPDEAQRTPR